METAAFAHLRILVQPVGHALVHGFTESDDLLVADLVAEKSTVGSLDHLLEFRSWELYVGQGKGLTSVVVGVQFAVGLSNDGVAVDLLEDEFVKHEQSGVGLVHKRVHSLIVCWSVLMADMWDSVVHNEHTASSWSE